MYTDDEFENLEIVSLTIKKDDGYLARNFEQMPVGMIGREFFINATEAETSEAEKTRAIYLESVIEDGVQKMAILNSGGDVPFGDELIDRLQINNTSKDPNHRGEGGRLSAAGSNRRGLIYTVRHKGIFYRATMIGRGETFGFVRIPYINEFGETDFSQYQILTADQLSAEDQRRYARIDESVDLFDVKFMGMSNGQNTFLDPYNQGKEAVPHTILNEITARVFAFKSAKPVAFYYGEGGGIQDRIQSFSDIIERDTNSGLIPKDRDEPTTHGDFTVRYVLANKDGAFKDLPGHAGPRVCILHDNEMFDAPKNLQSRVRLIDDFGFRGLAARLTILISYIGKERIEHDRDRAALTIARTKISCRDFDHIVYDGRPDWMDTELEKVNSYKKPSANKKLKDELQDYLNRFAVATAQGTGVRVAKGGNGGVAKTKTAATTTTTKTVNHPGGTSHAATAPGTGNQHTNLQSGQIVPGTRPNSRLIAPNIIWIDKSNIVKYPNLTNRAGEYQKVINEVYLNDQHWVIDAMTDFIVNRHFGGSTAARAHVRDEVCIHIEAAIGKWVCRTLVKLNKSGWNPNDLEQNALSTDVLTLQFESGFEDDHVANEIQSKARGRLPKAPPKAPAQVVKFATA